MANLKQKIYWLIKNFKRIEHDSLLIDSVKNNFQGPITYSFDSLVTSNNCDFINDEKFAKAYDLAKATNPWENFNSYWRVYINCWAASKALELEGDFVECGVNTGAYARAVIEYVGLNRSNKKFYLFDTYEGIVREQLTENEIKLGIQNYKYKNVYEEVTKTFDGLPAVIVKGKVPETLSEFKGNHVAYLSIDMNAVFPEIQAMNYFWPKVVKGGLVVLDDYGFPLHIEQKKAFDEFAKKNNFEILSLPTGQGLIIK